MQPAAESASVMAALSEAAAPEARVAVKTALTNTVRNRVRIRTAVPQFSGFPGTETLNRQIAQQTQSAEAALETSAEAASSGSAGETAFYSSYFDYTDRGGQLSVWVTWQSGADGARDGRGVSAWNVETATGKPCGTPDFLFRDRAGGGKWLTGQIEKKIRDRADVYFPDAARIVEKKGGNYDYYLDGDTLVVVFGSGEIAPPSADPVSFAFPLKEMAVGSPLSVPLSGQSSRGAVRVNGQDALMRNRPVPDGRGGYLLPLEDTCALLGLEITRGDGACAAGGKAVEPTLVQGVSYAPLSFFTETAGELLFYDGGVLRIFPKSAQG